MTNHQAVPARAKSSLWWVFGIILLSFYGLLSLNAGLKISEVMNGNAQPAQAVAAIRDQAEQGLAINPAEAEQVLPLWLNLSAKMGTEKFSYGSDSTTTTISDYYQMQSLDKFALSTHMMLGMVIMVFGSMQFWPAFRRRFPKAHRYIGMVYLLAAFSSMTLSIYHLIVTGPAKTYGEFSFYVGLWVLAIGTVISLTLSIYYIVKKDVVRHMGWQSLAFGFLLTAPLQRIHWIILPYFFSGLTSFNEMNFMVNVLLLVEAALIGYLIFFSNRASLNQNAMMIMDLPLTRENQNTVRSKKAWLILPILTWILCVCGFLIWPGFAHHQSAVELMPATLIAADSAIYADSFLNVLYVIMVGTALLSMTIWKTNPERFIKQRWMLVLALASIVSAAILSRWAFVMGLPSHAVSAGGTFYGMVAALLVLFSLLALWSEITHRLFLLDEMMRFLIAATVAPSLTYLTVFMLNQVGFVPEAFLADGHGYQVPVIMAILPGIVTAFLYAIYRPLPQVRARY